MTMTELTRSTFLDIDPATGETIAEIPIADANEVRDAVAKAQAAQASWGAATFDARAAALRAAIENVRTRSEELAELVTREMGKPIGDARREVAGCVDGANEALAEIGRALETEVIQEDGNETRVERHPLGVVAAITPWNFPVLMPIELFLPALGAGNAVVFKPSEHVPLTGKALAGCFADALPAGVFMTVLGAGATGADLVAADVDMIGFVGSRATGKRIMESASGGLKRLVLELGGKDPLIVFDDADLAAAADCVVTHALRNTGQVCCSVERVFVADSVAAEFEGLVLERAKQWSHGNGFTDGVRMGPMVSGEQRAKVEAQVADAVACGARLLMGGQTPAGEGYFYPATVLADAPDRAALSRDETFGPVIALNRFGGDEGEAVRLANDTPYGLGANVYTRDLERGRRVARSIRSGQVGVNRYLAATSKAPWVGARQSGFGYLGGIDGARQFTVPKSISYPI